jgi:hypothetical protein
MLAYWMGGACGYTFVPPIPGPVFLPSEGIGVGKRYPIDDEEILEFLELWTTWNDIE